MFGRRRAGPDPQDAFRDLVASRWGALVRYAYLFTGDRGDAEDLVQQSLERTWRRWRTVRIDAPEAYVRAAIANAAAARGRAHRLRVTSWELAGSAAETLTAADDAPAAEREPLWLALADLPPRMRAVVVLRVWEDLSEAETARILGCAAGTVKSQLSRALERLRAADAVRALDPRTGADPTGASS
jgi:RNA polymerase sigma-70 factor (sigma-E family)